MILVNQLGLTLHC